MKTKWTTIFWGFILIIAGAIFLVQNLGYLGEFKEQVWMIIFGVASLFFFGTYFINGIREWGWLFPACIFAALALTLWLTQMKVEGSVLGAPILAAVAIPFLVIFLLAPKQNGWALIPAWSMAVLTVIVFLADRVAGEWIGALVLLSIGLPFLIVYLRDRKHWWALIPAWSMFIIGLVVLFSSLVKGEWIGVLVLLGIALPFFVVYSRSKENWWAIIPAGILSSAAIPVFLVGLVGEKGVLAKPGVLNGFTFLGIALTFLVLWLRRSSLGTGWAIYVAIVTGTIGLISLLIGSADVAFPIAIIIVGLVVLYFALRPKKAA